MKSHIVSFLLEMRNGDGSVVDACMPGTAIADSLTPPPEDRSYPQRENDEQIDPEHCHEVPVHGGRGEDVHRFRAVVDLQACLLYTSPSPRDGLLSRMPSS